jgi:hypothetical protein
MTKTHYLLLLTLLTLSCNQPLEEESFPLPTQVCVRAYHHHQPIPDTKVYIKFNATEFPGYDRTGRIYDRVFNTGKQNLGCLAPLPEGRHCLVAFGYDSLYAPHDVYGSMWINISLKGRAKLDTIMYVSE